MEHLGLERLLAQCQTGNDFVYTPTKCWQTVTFNNLGMACLRNRMTSNGIAQQIDYGSGKVLRLVGQHNLFTVRNVEPLGSQSCRDCSLACRTGFYYLDSSSATYPQWHYHQCG